MSDAAPLGADPNVGWKFHLNFDVDNPATTTRVEQFARALEAEGSLLAFKVGSGGGKATGDNRKEATLYAGSMANALAVAERLESELGDILLPPDRATMRDDVPMTKTGKTWARFTALAGLSGSYHQYGSRGICHLKADMQPTAWGGQPDPEHARANALNALEADFGSYFTGADRELDGILARSDRVERAGTRTVFGWDPADDVTRDVTLNADELQWWRALPAAAWDGAPHATPQAPEPWWVEAPERDYGIGLA